ncbi:uncharacterized protein LOC112600825 [Melanaphis sacchari]|uniref:uncharacterized protein LOC112600825 n=1 Tax=Melanaphis sacchari TaxID=742174 RepID=UPI000DC13A27|nr:uncharacterized protein LOC112600825 [Melanaphis sacchari]
MHKWLQLPANPTEDPLATVYPINHYKKSHVYAVTRINPIYVDDENVHHTSNETWKNKSGSSGYDSQPHSDHSSLDKGSPPGTKCLRNGTTPPSSDESSGSPVQRAAAPWLLSPIKEGVIDVHQYCIPRPVWPGHGDGGTHGYPADLDRIPRVKCCRHCARCRCRSSSSTSSSSTGSTNSGGKIVSGGGSFSGYSSAFGGGTISTGSTSTTSSGGGAGLCLDDVNPSPAGNGPVVSNRSPLTLDPRFSDGVGINKALVDNWNTVELRLNQKTDHLHYDCGAMLRGLQFTLDTQQAEKLMQKIKVGKKHRCWCRFITACVGLIMFLVSVVTVSLTLTRGQKMFGSL